MSQIANISGPLKEHQRHAAFCIIQNYTNGDFNIVLTNYQTGINHLREGFWIPILNLNKLRSQVSQI